MKLKVFHAADGDCLLLTSGDGHHALIDGGRTTTFKAQTWAALQELQEAGEALDLVVVSHIDNDHVSGLLWFFKLVQEWTKVDFQRSARAANPKPVEDPKFARPPVVKKVWHNAWRDQLGDLSRPIEDLVAQVPGAAEAASADPSLLTAATVQMLSSLQDLAESVDSAAKLRTLIDAGVPAKRNAPFKELVLLTRKAHVEPLGTTSLTVLGPKVEHLEALREEWRQHLAKVKKPKGPAGPGPATGGDELSMALSALSAERQTLLESLAEAAQVIEKSGASRVTAPNRASITLLAEEEGRTCLLTGDAAEVELLDGLTATRRLKKRGHFACNVLKVQHHGSENNLSLDFAQRVTADHYVFCGNGAHHNPDPKVIATIVEGRRTVDPRPFTFWFNCSPARTNDDRRASLKEAIGEAEAAAAANPDITVRVLPDDEAFLEITV